MPELKPLARGFQHWNGKRPVPPYHGMGCVVAGSINEVTWAKIQPTPDTYDFSIIDRIIKYAEDNDVPAVAIRCTSGMDAPDWVKQECDTFPHFNPKDQTIEQVRTCVRFWTPLYLEIYESFWRKLAECYDDHPSVTHVYNAVAMTRYDEPFIRGLGDKDVAGWMREAGYTFAADRAAQIEAFKMHRRWWYRTRLATAFNPWQDIEAMKTRVPETLEIINIMYDILGHQAIGQNNSVRASYTSLAPDAPYARMYAHLRSWAERGYPVAFQSAAPKDIGDYRTTLDLMVRLGGIFSETLPTIYDSLGPDDRERIYNSFVSNAASRLTPEEKVRVLSTERDSLTQQVGDLKSNFDAVTSRLSTTEASLNEANSQLVSTQQRLEAYSEQLLHLTEALRTLMDEHTAWLAQAS